MSPPLSCTNGRAVNVSATISPRFSTLCECDEGFSGASDFYDARVLGELALDCVNSNLGTMAVWGVCFACYLLRQILLAVSLAYQVRSKGIIRPPRHARPRCGARFRACCGFTPYRVLIAETFFINPMMLVACMWRVLNAADSPLGTSVVATVTYSWYVSASLFFFVDFTTFQFEVLTVSRTLSRDKGKKLLHVFKFVSFGFACIYLVFAAIPQLAMLGLDKSLGPSGSKQVDLLLLRNCGIAAWFALQAIASVLTAWEARALLGGFKTSERTEGAQAEGEGTAYDTSVAAGAEVEPRGSGLRKSDGILPRRSGIDSVRKKKTEVVRPGISPSAETAIAVIAFLNAQTRSHVIQSSLFTIIFLSFCAPPLWPYQQYAFVPLLSLGSVANNEGLTLLRASWAARRVARKSLPNKSPLDTGGSEPQRNNNNGILANNPLIQNGDATPLSSRSDPRRDENSGRGRDVDSRPPDHPPSDSHTGTRTSLAHSHSHVEA